MLKSALSTIRKYNMIAPYDRIVVGVSGGPDSMALLHLLYSLAPEYSLYICAAHLNHMLRGEESEKDTRFVEDYCKSNGIPCIVKYADITDEAQITGLSLEEAGRKARYDLFLEAAAKNNCSKIALAHNLNDQAETVLMRMMRGTGLLGLCGMDFIRDNMYIRPLLNTKRSEIEEYCRENRLNPRIDSTNLEPIYTRNKIRLQLVPYIKKNFNPNAEENISSMAELLKDDNDFLEGSTEEIYKKAAAESGGSTAIKISLIKNEHPAIVKRILRRAVSSVKGNLTGIESRHIEIIMSIINEGRTGAAVELPGNIRSYVSYGSLIIEKQKENTIKKFQHEIAMPGITYIDEINSLIESEIIENNITPNTGNRFVKYFDYDKIKGNLTIRLRCEGDYMRPLGMRGTKKLKEVFIDDKVPREIRDKIPLVAINSEIVWAVGFRINDKYKIDSSTKKVLKLQYKEHGRNNNV